MSQGLKLLTKVKDTSKNAKEKMETKLEINDYVSFSFLIQFHFTITYILTLILNQTAKNETTSLELKNMDEKFK